MLDHAARLRVPRPHGRRVPSGRGGDRALALEAQLRRRVPQAHLAAPAGRRVVEVLVDDVGRLARRASRSGCRGAGWRRCRAGARCSGRAPRTSRGPRSGVAPSVVRKLPIITPLSPALTASRLQLAEVLDAPAAQAEQRVGEDQAEDRDPLDGLPRIHQLALAELRARARVQQVDRHARRVDLARARRPSRRAARGVSPRLRMPPTHVSSPASRTASIVRSRPS